MTRPWLLAALALAAQDLGELARREAQRRAGIEAQGGADRKIVQADLERARPGGNVTTFSVPALRTPAPPAPRPAGGRTAERYRSALQRLDRQIASVEDRIGALRARAEAEKWEIRRAGRSGSRAPAERAPPKRELAIREQEVKLRRLRQERFETYDAGRRAGFLPGELDGKGIVP
jgi:hypothetical protein